MKLLALVLLLLNAALWYGLKGVPGYSRASSVATGALPRVEGLRSVDSHSDVSLGALEVQSCVTVGWFSTAENAKVLAEKGRPLEHVSYQITKRARELSPLHWVIIPPQPEQIALAQLKKLRELGVDSYLVAEGGSRNAISLGLFESREAAISVLEEKKRQNLNAILANFTRNQISYALSFEVSSELVEKQVQAVEADYGNNFDFIEINPCEGVARPGKNP